MTFTAASTQTERPESLFAAMRDAVKDVVRNLTNIALAARVKLEASLGLNNAPATARPTPGSLAFAQATLGFGSGSPATVRTAQNMSRSKRHQE